MRSIRWWFRVFFFGILAIGLGAYLVATTPWRNWLGLLPDYAKEIAEGDRIVSAMEAFKAQRGLWPEYLDDLSPEFLPQPPGPRWFYELTPVNDSIPAATRPAPRLIPSLSTNATQEGTAHAHLGYDFDRAAPAWHLFGNTDERLLRTGRTATTFPSTLPALQTEALALAELDRRIKREPGALEHWRAKASLQQITGDHVGARSTITAAAEKFPDSAWPQLALAMLDSAVSDSRPAAVAKFAAWVKQHPSFTHDYHLSWLDRFMHDDEAAALAMTAAIHHSVDVESDDTQIAAFYFWDMARWALAQQKWELVLALTNAWEAAQTDALVKEQSFLPMRAAAELATGNAAAAKKDLDALKSPQKIWARNLDGPAGLRAAVDRGDKSYRYTPGDFPPPYQVFELPE